MFLEGDVTRGFLLAQLASSSVQFVGFGPEMRILYEKLETVSKRKQMNAAV